MLARDRDSERGPEAGPRQHSPRSENAADPPAQLRRGDAGQAQARPIIVEALRGAPITESDQPIDTFNAILMTLAPRGRLFRAESDARVVDLVGGQCATWWNFTSPPLRRMGSTAGGRPIRKVPSLVDGNRELDRTVRCRTSSTTRSNTRRTATDAPDVRVSPRTRRWSAI